MGETIFLPRKDRKDKAGGKVTRLALVAGSYIRFQGELLLEATSSAERFDLIVSPAGEAEIDMAPENLSYRLRI